jgi:hypothetical protein
LTYFKTPKYHIQGIKVIFTPKTLCFSKNRKSAPLKNPKWQFAGRFCKIHHKLILQLFDLKPTGKPSKHPILFPEKKSDLKPVPN